LFSLRKVPARRPGRVLSLLLSLALLALAGCTESKPPEPPKPTYKGELVLWAAPGLAGSPVQKPEAPWFEEQANAFETKHEGITVTVRLFDTPAALEKAVAEGQEWQPDLAFGRLHLAEAAPRMESQVEMLLDAPVLALNPYSFGDAGVPLPANDRWTHAEFENSLEKLSSDSRFGLGFYQLPGYHEWWPLLSGLVGSDLVVQQGAETGLANLVRYRKEGWLHPDTGKVKAEEIWSLFAKREIAVMPVSTWAVPLLREAPYNVNLAVAGFPSDFTTGYRYGFMLAKQQDPLKREAAAALANFMALPEQQVRLARETGLLPAAKGAPNPFEGDAHMTRIYQLAAAQRPLPAGPAWDQAQQAFFRPLLIATFGDTEAKAALADIQQHIQQATAPK
jgi:maltose-binding protein MalE